MTNFAVSPYTPCSAVEQGCKSPANLDVSDEEDSNAASRMSARTTCFKCGGAVCTNVECSSRVRYFKKRVRLCSGCRDEVREDRE